MATLSDRGQGNMLAFLNKLAAIVNRRPQTVLVVTDPADQRAYAKEASKVGDSLAAAALKLDDMFGRRMTDFDPIGEEAASIIMRRLFEKVDPASAHAASATYNALYERVTRDNPGLIPPDSTGASYAKRIVECYPFHARLKGAFRSSVAYWLGDGELATVDSFEELRKLVDTWDGTYPDPGQWIRAERIARKAAEQKVESMQELADRREKEAKEAQIAAARVRLVRELGRYLACLGFGTQDLNSVFYEQMKRDTAGSQRLKRCLERLGGYPEWPSSLCQELEAFVKALPENQRKARLMGNEIDAALEDPRWGVCLGP